MFTPIADLIVKVISAQEPIIGPLAWEVACGVKGLSIKDHHVEVQGKAPQVLSGLMKAYEGLFGPASLEVSRDAIRSLGASVDKSMLPNGLI